MNSRRKASNAALVVVGDLDPAATKAWIEKYFAAIPSSPLPAKADISEPRQEKEKRASKPDALATRPALAVGYHAPKPNTSEYYAMGLLDQILVQGKDSRLYQALVQNKGMTGEVEGGINSVLGDMYNINGPTLWDVSLFYDGDKSSEEILAVFDVEIEKVRSTPVDQATLDRALVKFRSSLYDKMEEFGGFGKADLLASFALLMESLASRLRTVHSYYRLAVRARETLFRGSFDLMQVEFAETAVFLRPPEGFPAALTLHDVKAKPAARRYEASRGAARGIRWGSWRVTQVLEQRAAIPFGVVFTLSEVDREWAERLYRGLRFRVLRYPAGLEFRGAHRAEVTGRILFVGALNRPENTEAVRYFLGHVWPTVRERFTDSEFWVAGGGLGETLRKELLSDSRVRVTGHVENLEEIYATASVFVAPVLAGGGVIVRILDALAADPLKVMSAGMQLKGYAQ